MAKTKSDSDCGSTDADVFEQLSRAQRTSLFRAARVRTFEKDHLIFAPGDESDVVYHVITGSVKIYDTTFDGKEIIFRMCGPSTWFGMSGVFGGDVRPVFAETQDTTEVYMIALRDFEAVVREDPGFAVAVIQMLGMRLRQAHGAIAQFAIGDVRSRIAQVLLKVAAASPAQDGTRIVDAPMTHQEIANMVGATRSTVTKILNVWKTQGIVRVVGGRIEIHDPKKLARSIQR